MPKIGVQQVKKPRNSESRAAPVCINQAFRLPLTQWDFNLGIFPKSYFLCSYDSWRAEVRACPTNGSDRGSLRSHDLTLFVMLVTSNILIPCSLAVAPKYSIPKEQIVGWAKLAGPSRSEHRWARCAWPILPLFRAMQVSGMHH